MVVDIVIVAVAGFREWPEMLASLDMIDPPRLFFIYVNNNCSSHWAVSVCPLFRAIWSGVSPPWCLNRGFVQSSFGILGNSALAR